MVVAWTIPLMAQGDPSDGMPELLFHEDKSSDYPFWVADHLILNEKSEVIDPSLIDDGIKIVIRRLLENPPEQGGCYPASGRMPNPHTQGRETVGDTIRAVDWVFTAKVTGLQSGFYGSSPGTLVRVEPDRVFKGPEGRRGPHYVFMPVGELTLGPYQYCRTTVRSADLPGLDDELLLMVNLWPINEGEMLKGDESMIVTLYEDRRISVPGQFKKKDRKTMMLTKEAFLRKVEQYVAEKVQRTNLCS